MRRFAILALISIVPVLAQFTDLATTQDGSEVFFVTTSRQRGTDQFPHGKVFALDRNGIRLLFQRERDSLYYMSPFLPSSITASGDGSLAAFDLRALCLGGSSCLFRELSQGHLLDRASGEETSPGPHVRISRNGRYVLWFRSTGAFAVGARAGILDRSTGQSREFQSSPIDGVVASNGTVLLVRYDGLVVAKPDGTESLLIPSSGIGRAAIDDEGTVAVVEKAPRRLFALDLATAKVFYPAPDTRDSYGASLSADGRSLLYISVIGQTPQLFFSAIDGAGWKQLTTSDEGVSAAALSGDGRIAWASTPAGRLLEIDTATGETRDALAPPVISAVSSPAVPGSLIRIQGQRLGEQVRMDGREVNVVSAAPGEVLAQVPWDLPRPEEYVTVSDVRDDSPLEAVTQEYTVSFAVFQPTAFVPPVHEDWHGFVTEEDPARPGEILHIYATGLGPVDDTGRPATPIQWDYWWTDTDSIPAEVLYAGLAPGLTGLYQIDARVPANPPASRLKLIANRFGFNVAADFSVAPQP